MRGIVCAGAVGMLLALPDLATAADAVTQPPVTFAKDVAPILQEMPGVSPQGNSGADVAGDL